MSRLATFVGIRAITLRVFRYCALITAVCALHALRWHGALAESRVFGELCSVAALVAIAAAARRGRSRCGTFSLRSDDLMVQWHAVCAGYGLGFLGQYQAHGQTDLLRVLPAITSRPARSCST